jgi:hypothetical protein
MSKPVWEYESPKVMRNFSEHGSPVLVGSAELEVLVLVAVVNVDEDVETQLDVENDVVTGVVVVVTTVVLEVEDEVDVLLLVEVPGTHWSKTV